MPCGEDLRMWLVLVLRAWCEHVAAPLDLSDPYALALCRVLL